MKPTLPTTVRISSLLALALAIAIPAGCVSKGPAERAGERFDRGVQGARDVISPPGPAEKAGRSVDRIVNP